MVLQVLDNSGSVLVGFGLTSKVTGQELDPH
jgi:hypothetical protein